MNFVVNSLRNIYITLSMQTYIQCNEFVCCLNPLKENKSDLLLCFAMSLTSENICLTICSPSEGLYHDISEMHT